MENPSIHYRFIIFQKHTQNFIQQLFKAIQLRNNPFFPLSFVFHYSSFQALFFFFIPIFYRIYRTPTHF